MLLTIVIGGYIAKSPYPTASKAKNVRATEVESAKSPVLVSRASSPSPKSPAAAVPAKRKRVPKVLDEEEEPEPEPEVQPKKTVKKSKAASSRTRR
jgi:hypothetical protein